MKDETRKLKLYTRRALILGGIKVVFLASTMFRFYYMQVVDGVRYKMLSNKNRIRIIPIFPQRGKIFDRDGTELAKNITTYSLYKEAPKAEELQTIRSILDGFERNANPNNIHFDGKKFVYANLSWKELSKIATNNNLLPGFEVVESSRRIYPQAKLAGHITGYITEDKARTEQGKRGGIKGNSNSFTKGVAGAEYTFEEKLYGTIGQRKIEVNSRNRFVREIGHTKSVNGADVKLSISCKLHEYADEVIGNRQGTVIVQKISTGEVICMYSKPNYNPNIFIDGLSNAEWNAIQNDPGHPLLNKAITGIFPPGSIFKIISSIAALQHNVNPSEKFECRGHHIVGSRKVHCWNRGGHGMVNMHTAIEKSCNVYFYKVAERIGIESIHKAANSLQINGKTGLELSGEASCFVPNKEWKRRHLNAQWYKGDTINACVGQGYVTFTPIGLNALVARVASGKLVKPTILCTNSDCNISPKFSELEVDVEHLKIVRHGMYLASNKRSGSSSPSKLSIPGFQLCGKTGTAQVVSLSNYSKDSGNRNIEDHSLFNGFAPYNTPEFAITVIVEHGSWGSRAAAPAAKKMMEYVHKLFV